MLDPPRRHPDTTRLRLVVSGCLLGGSNTDPLPNNGVSYRIEPQSWRFSGGWSYFTEHREPQSRDDDLPLTAS